MPCGKDTTDALHAERSSSSSLDGHTGSPLPACQNECACPPPSTSSASAKDYPFVRDTLPSPLLTQDYQPLMHACPRFISSDANSNNNNSGNHQASGNQMEQEQQPHQQHYKLHPQQEQHQQQLPSPAAETHPSSLLSDTLPTHPHIIYPQLSSADHKGEEPTLPPLANFDVDHHLEPSARTHPHPTKREAGAKELEHKEGRRRHPSTEPALDMGQESRQPRRFASLKRRKLGEPSLKRPSFYNPSSPTSSHSSQPQTTPIARNTTPLPTPPSDTAACEGILSQCPKDAIRDTEQQQQYDRTEISGALSPMSPSAGMLTCVPFPLDETDGQYDENGPQQQHDHNNIHCATQGINSTSCQSGTMVTTGNSTADTTPLSANDNNTPAASSSSFSPSTPPCGLNNADQKQEKNQRTAPFAPPNISSVHNGRNMDGGVDGMRKPIEDHHHSQQQPRQGNPEHDLAHMDLLAHHSIFRQEEEDKQAAEDAEAAAVALVAASTAAVAAANANAYTHRNIAAEASTQQPTYMASRTGSSTSSRDMLHPSQQQELHRWQFSAIPMKQPFVFSHPMTDKDTSVLMYVESSAAATALPKALFGSRKRSFEDAIEMAQPLREEEPSTLEHPGWLGAIKRRKIHHSAVLWTSSLSPSPYVKLLAIRGFWEVMKSRVDLAWMDPKLYMSSYDSSDEDDNRQSGKSEDLDMDDPEDHFDTFSSPSSGTDESDEGTESCCEEDDATEVLYREWMDTSSQGRLSSKEDGGRAAVNVKKPKRPWVAGDRGEDGFSGAGTSMTSTRPDMASVFRTSRRSKGSRRVPATNCKERPTATPRMATTWDFRAPTSSTTSAPCSSCIRRVVMKHPNTNVLFRGLWAEEERNRRRRQQIPDGVHKPSRSKIINSRPLARAHGPIRLTRSYGGPSSEQPQIQQQYPKRRSRTLPVTMMQTSEVNDQDNNCEEKEGSVSNNGETSAASTREERERQQQQDCELQLRRKHGLKTPLRNPSILEASAGYDLSDYRPWKDGTISPQRGCIQTLDRLRTHLLEPWPKEEAKAKDECTRILHRMREQLNVVINLQIHLRSMMKSAPNQLSFLLSIRHPGQVSIELLQALYGPQFMDSSAFRTIEQLLWGSDGYHRRAGTSSSLSEVPQSHLTEEEDHTPACQQNQQQQQHYQHQHHHPHHHLEYKHDGQVRDAHDTYNKHEEDDENDKDMSGSPSVDRHSSMETTVDSLGIH